MRGPSVTLGAQVFENIIGKGLSEPDVQFLLRSSQGEQEVSDLDTEFAVEAPDRGLAFKFDERIRLSSFFFEGRGPPHAAAAFVGDLPRGLTFAMSRAAARAQLGEPSVARDATSPTTGEHLCWDRYDWREVSLHLQYSADATRIQLVTLMAPWRVPE